MKQQEEGNKEDKSKLNSKHYEDRIYVVGLLLSSITLLYTDWSVALKCTLGFNSGRNFGRVLGSVELFHST